MERRLFLESFGFLSVAGSGLIPNIDNSIFFKEGWDRIRAQFPLSTERVYMNNGTFGPSPLQVLNQLSQSYQKINTSGNYGHTDETRKKLASFVGASESEISLTHNTTEGINIICAGIPMKAGDEVIISLQEHVGNALPWIYRSQRDKIKLKTFEPGKTADETIEMIKKLISPKTRVLAIPHITCTTGQILPIQEIAVIARNKSIFTAIDGAHGTGMMDLDIKKLGIDSYATCCHKWMLGPGGTGFLYLKEEMIDSIKPVHVGAYSDTGWSLYSDPPAIAGLNPTAHRFDYGTQGTALYEGAGAAVEFHEKIGKKKIEKRTKELADHFFFGMKELPNYYKLVSSDESISRSAMITFQPLRMDYKDCNKKLSEAGFRVRAVPESNLNGIRVSMHIYNSMEEVDQLLEVLKNMVK
jgi:L-cysteine/cystine lyase